MFKYTIKMLSICSDDEYLTGWLCEVDALIAVMYGKTMLVLNGVSLW